MKAISSVSGLKAWPSGKNTMLEQSWMLRPVRPGMTLMLEAFPKNPFIREVFDPLLLRIETFEIAGQCWRQMHTLDDLLDLDL